MRVPRKLLIVVMAWMVAGPWPAPTLAGPAEDSKPVPISLSPVPREPAPQEHALEAKRLPVRVDDVSAELVPAELYGAVYSGADGVASLYRIDPSTGAGSLIGSTGFQRVSAMDFDASGRLLATGERDDGSNTSVLISLNLATGKGTEIGPTNVVATGFGDTLSDMSFRNADGRLYAYIEAFDGVGVIDPMTGAVTPLGASGLSSAGNGIAFRADDALFHADQSRVHTLDQTTGNATTVAGLVWSPPADSFPRVNAMDFHPSSGTLYASVQDGGGGSESYLATLDVGSGVVSVIGAAPLGLDALAWRPARAVPSLPPLAPALYGAAYNGPNGLATLYRIDPVSAQAAFIGPIGFERVSAMDFDPYGVLYATGERADGSNTSVLLTIDVHTGRGTEVGPTNVVALGFGSSFADIDFRRGDGRLYGYIEPGDGVAVIDPLTGNATALGSSGFPSAGNGVAFDAAGTTLYHANHGWVSTIDQVTGVLTLGPGLIFPPYLANSPRVNAMDAHPATGELWASIRNFAAPTHFLAKVDPVSGFVAGIGPTVAGLDAIAWGGIQCGLIDFEGLPGFTGIGKVDGAVTVTFGPEWLSLVDSDAGGSGNIANEPSPDTIAFQIGPMTPIELSEGVRFVRVHFVADPSATPVELYAYDGPGAGGNLVSFDTRSTGGVNPPALCTGDPTGSFCLWDALTVVSATDDIRSLLAYNLAPGAVGYDDLTWCQGPPDLLYGAAFSGPDGLATLHRIDPDTGGTIAVGPIGYQRVSAMDFDRRGTLYATGERNDGSNTNVLLTVDTATGAGTEVGPTGVTGLGFGDVLTDMSFRNADGKLYAYIDIADGLATIDPFTGTASLVGPTGIGSAGNGMAFDPGDILWHANQSTFNIIDQTTGAASVAGALLWSPPADLSPRVNAMDFRPRTRIPYVSVNDGFGGSENYLGTLSLVTGTVRIIGPTALGLDALAWRTTGQPPLPTEVSPPFAAVPLTVGVAGPALLKLEWQPTTGAESYRLFIGDYGVLRPMGGVVVGNAPSSQSASTRPRR